MAATTATETDPPDTTVRDATPAQDPSLIDATAAPMMELQEIDFCKTRCGKAHTMCKYEETNEAACSVQEGNTGPGKLDTDRYLSTEEEVAMLDRHNELRREAKLGDLPCHPGAILMNNLTWNSQLAASAERWASQCTKGHDECRILLNGTSVGQNIAEGWFPGGFDKNYHLDAIDMWFNERRHFPPSFVEEYHVPRGKMTDNYVQMVWANTKAVGCARSYFGSGTLLIVCNYAPAGNILGEYVYWPTSEDYSTCQIEAVPEPPKNDSVPENAARRIVLSKFMFAVTLIFIIKHCDFLANI